MRFPPRLVLSLVLLLAATPAARAVVFVVDTTANASDALLTDALCDTGANECSLRAAIEQANATPGADRIEFAIPGPVPHEILIGTAPAILESLAIDGTTQPGSSVNTLTIGTNAVFGISLSGEDGFGLRTGAAIQVDAPNVEIAGFAIVGVGTQAGAVLPCVAFGPNSSGSRFRGNSVRCANDPGAVHVDGDRVRIGDPALASRNLIHEASSGITVTGDSNFIVNNLIGTDASGAVPSGAGTGIDLAGDGNAVTDNLVAANAHGVSIRGDGNTLLRNRIGGLTAFDLGNTIGVLISGSGNRIGLPSAVLAQANDFHGNDVGLQLVAPGGANLVEGNRFGGFGLSNGGALAIFGSSGNTISGNEISQNIAGVSVNEAAAPAIAAIDNAILANRIWANTQYDLKLGVSGSPHDDAPVGLAPDADEGPNHLQNPPHITSVALSQGETTITGNIDAVAGRYTLEFFSNIACSAGEREGRFYLGSAILDATGTFTNPRTAFSFTLPVTAQGGGFTATATDADGNTSEFGACYAATITGGADLVLTGSPSAITLDPDDAMRFSFRLENLGPFAASNIPVVVSVPPGFLSAWAPAPGFDLATSTWTVPSLAVGAVAELDLDTTVEPAAAGPFVVNARAEMGLSELDPNSTNNAASLTGFVRSGADLVVSQVAPASAQDGELVTFVVTVHNAGPEDASSVTVSGTLDEGLVFDSTSETLPSRFSYAPATRRWTWDAQDLADQATATLDVNARVDAALAPDLGLLHTVSAFAASPSDPFPGLSTVGVGLYAAADMEITRFRTQGPRSADEDLKEGWFVTVTNTGPDRIERFVIRVECGTRRLYVLSSGISPSPTCPDSLATAIACPLVCSMGPLSSGEEGKFNFTSDFTVATQAPLTVSVEPDPAFPYYDPGVSNDSSTWLGYSGPAVAWACGLLGIESPILLGLLVLLRGRKGRAAFRRIFPGAALALVLLLGGSARTAHAAPVTLAVDSGASSATVAVTSTLGSPPPVAVVLSGSVDAEVVLGTEAPFGLVGQSLQLTGAAIALSDFSIVLSSVPLYDLTFDGSGVVGSLSGPAVSGFAVSPGLSLFDLFGSSLTFDSGSIDATGTYYGFPVSETFDFSSFPLHSVFPANSVAQLQVVDLGGGTAELRLAFPFSAPLQLTIDSEPVSVTVAGTLVLTGQVVPEPGTAPLLAAGLIAFALRWRKRCPGAA